MALLEREGERVGLPVKTLVRAAWLLDLYGDLGKKAEVETARREPWRTRCQDAKSQAFFTFKVLESGGSGAQD